MLHKILIANRGEIAVRIAKTAKALGIQTVAVYSDADRNAMHVDVADEAVFIGPANPKDSYLAIDKIIDAAKQTNAQAIHPGYGFLSENAIFAKRCEAENIIFIGPPASAIEAMGNKANAKQILESADVPLVPGFHDESASDAELKTEASRIGFPLLIKASAGGGGKGMRQVDNLEEFDTALASARREAQQAFANSNVLLEKYLAQPRHVEVQVFCDQQGNGVYLYERDCSIQRRHQKVVEEAPAPGMTEALRKRMGQAALNVAKAINYCGAGTVEFLLDSDGKFYFMEMNTRLQVEHPVTESITGQDLVAWQLAVADGKPLPIAQDEIPLNGHAIEVRLYAEDPANQYLPATGTIDHWRPPALCNNDTGIVRLDTGVTEGDTVYPFYDPMLAKLIVWAPTRSEAVIRMQKALAEFHIGGVKTNRAFLYELMQLPAFDQAQLSTHFIDQQQSALIAQRQQWRDEQLAPDAVYAVAGLLSQRHQNQAGGDIWQQPSHFRMNVPNIEHKTLWQGEDEIPLSIRHIDEHNVVISDGNKDYKVEFEHTAPDTTTVLIDEQRLQLDLDVQANKVRVFLPHKTISFETHKDYQTADDQHEGGVTAPMAGVIVEVSVKAGDTLNKGDVMLIMEAMKMEHSVTAPYNAKVKAVFYKAGDTVTEGAALVDLEECE